MLCYLEGKTNEEAAHFLGCRTDALKKRLSRARDLLRQRLSRRGVSVTAATMAALLAQETQAQVVPAVLLGNVHRVPAWLTGKGEFAAPPAALELAEAVMGAMERTGGRLYAALGALVAVLGVGMLLVVAPDSRDKVEPSAKVPLTGDSTRIFHSAIPLLVFAEQKTRAEPGRLLGTTLVRQGVSVPSGGNWWVMPVMDLRVMEKPPPLVHAFGAGGMVLQTPRMTGPVLQAFVNEIRRQGVPGVYICDPDFTDDDLAQLAGLPCLEMLRVRSARITSTGLLRLHRLPRLRRLSVEVPQLTGASLASFSNLEALTVRLGPAGRLGDDFSHYLSGMTRLKRLELSHPGIEDTGWKNTLSLRCGLEELSLEECNISPHGLSALQRFTGLKRLELYRCHGDDSMLQALAEIPRLESLVVDSCSYSDVRWLRRPGTGWDAWHQELYCSQWRFMWGRERFKPPRESITDTGVEAPRPVRVTFTAAGNRQRWDHGRRNPGPEFVEESAVSETPRPTD